MEEPLVSAPQTEAPKRPSMSLAARLMNIFAVPGDVFEELKGSAPLVANWLVPTLVFALVGALSAIIIFSQPAIQQQLREQQAKAMDQKVKAGKITQAQADQAQAMIEKFTGPAMMKVFGSVGAVLVSFWRLFWWALVLFLFSRWFLKAPIGYLKAAEVAGLATMVTVLGALVALLLTVNLARLFAGPSLALVI